MTPRDPHLWGEATAGKPTSEHARWNDCPTCGTATLRVLTHGFDCRYDPDAIDQLGEVQAIAGGRWTANVLHAGQTITVWYRDQDRIANTSRPRGLVVAEHRCGQRIEGRIGWINPRRDTPTPAATIPF